MPAQAQDSAERSLNATASNGESIFFFYVLLTVYLGISLDNDQLDTHLLYFTICLL